MKQEIIKTDVLIIGGGGAGVRAAIEADKQGVSVALINKGVVSRSGLTPMAGYSYQAAFGHADPKDNPEVHFEDMVREGRGLGDENLIHALVQEAKERALDLAHYGVHFARKDGKFAQVRHPGQTYPRINRIPGRGYQMMLGLKKHLLRNTKVDVYEDCLVSKILSDPQRIPSGVVVYLQREGTVKVFQCKTLILATGGYEELWEKTDTAPDSTGDGISLAADLGTKLVDLEMALYYPVVTFGSKVYPGTMRQVLQYESLLEKEYLGGKLLNALGEEFIPPGKLPVRDVLMALILKEAEEGRATERGGVFTDLSKSHLNLEEKERMIEQIGCQVQFKRVEHLGIDLRKDPVEVGPAVHYCLGGVRINEWTETSVSNLYAAGEVTGNVHGANRISGNALAETQVFGRRAGFRAGQRAKELEAFPTISPPQVDTEIKKISALFDHKKNSLRPVKIRKEINRIMETWVSLKRSDTGLRKAIEAFKQIQDNDLPRMQVQDEKIFNNELQEAIEVGFMAKTAEMVAQAALLRKESRGHHLRSDYPNEDPSWLKHTVVEKKGRELICTTAPVVRLKE
ncbi:MAG: FAD-binding protein [Deltaproteobacteria bacterium]|nr:FAD-binding protein [Deltaproteobacteria bacterium]